METVSGCTCAPHRFGTVIQVMLRCGSMLENANVIRHITGLRLSTSITCIAPPFHAGCFPRFAPRGRGAIHSGGRWGKKRAVTPASLPSPGAAAGEAGGHSLLDHALLAFPQRHFLD